MGPEFWLQVVIAVGSAIGAGLGAFMAIKTQLALAQAQADRALKTADAAHQRLDGCMRACR